MKDSELQAYFRELRKRQFEFQHNEHGVFELGDLIGFAESAQIDIPKLMAIIEELKQKKKKKERFEIGVEEMTNFVSHLENPKPRNAAFKKARAKFKQKYKTDSDKGGGPQ